MKGKGKGDGRKASGAVQPETAAVSESPQVPGLSAGRAGFKVIAVSGTPGTGKSTLAGRIARRYGLKLVDVNRLVEDDGLRDGYDRQRDCMIVDTAKLEEAVMKKIRRAKKSGARGIVLDSHLSHHLPAGMIGLVAVTRCGLKTLRQRLEARGYSGRKVRENLDAEIFDVCCQEALDMDHRVLVVDTEKAISWRELDKIFI